MKQTQLKAAKLLRAVMLIWAFAMKWLPKRSVDNPKRILVMAFGGVGDAIMMIPTLAILREKRPNAHIALLVSTASGAPTIFQAFPELYDELIAISPTPASWKEAFTQNLKLMRKQFDCALISYISSYSLSTLLPALRSTPKHLLAIVDRHPLRKIYERLFEHRVLLFWESEMRSEILIHQEILRGIEPTYAPRAVEWRWNLVLPAEAQRLAIHWLSQNELWEALQNRPKPFSVLHMSASSAQDYKKLPLSKLAKVVEWLSAQGVSVVVVGTPTESSSLNELQALVNIPLRGCFHLDLLTVAALIRHAAIVLSSDSGIGHLAILVDTPTVRIFGPSFYWGFRKWKEGPFADIFPQIECAPCLRLGILNEKGLSALNCGHRNCLNQLSEHLVIEAVQSALSEKYSALSQKQNRI